MNLENQVISLDIAKQLRKLGVKQLSLFYYCERLNGYHNETDMKLLFNKETDFDEISKYSAFTLAELGNFFEKEIVSGKDFSGGFFCRAIYPDEQNMIVFDDLSEANTRAKMLIDIIEKGLFKVEDLP